MSQHDPERPPEMCGGCGLTAADCECEDDADCPACCGDGCGACNGSGLLSGFFDAEPADD